MRARGRGRIRHRAGGLIRGTEDTALRLLASGRLVVDPLSTHRFAWKNAAAAYDTLARWEPGMLGTILDWQAS